MADANSAPKQEETPAADNGQQEVKTAAPAAGNKKMLPAGAKNPILALLLSLFCLGGIGQLYLGQTTKGVILIVGTIIFSALGGLGIVVAIIGAYEAYAIAQKLERGEPVEENEWAIDFLNNMFNK